MKIWLAMTSSFCCSSPCTLTAPCAPYSRAMPALRTAEPMFLATLCEGRMGMSDPLVGTSLRNPELWYSGLH